MDLHGCLLLLLGVRAYTVRPNFAMNSVVFSRFLWQPWSLVSSVSSSSHISALIALKIMWNEAGFFFLLCSQAIISYGQGSSSFLLRSQSINSYEHPQSKPASQNTAYLPNCIHVGNGVLCVWPFFPTIKVAILGMYL